MINFGIDLLFSLMVYFFLIKFFSFVIYQAFKIWWHEYASVFMYVLIVLFLIQVYRNFISGYGLLSRHMFQEEIIELFIVLLSCDIGMYFIVKKGKAKKKCDCKTTGIHTCGGNCTCGKEEDNV